MLIPLQNTVDQDQDRDRWSHRDIRCNPWCVGRGVCIKIRQGPQDPPHNALLHQYLQIMRKLNDKLKYIVGMERVQLTSNRMADLKCEELGLVVTMKRSVFILSVNPGCWKISITWHSWFDWMFYDHFSARSLLAKLGSWRRWRSFVVNVEDRYATVLEWWLYSFFYKMTNRANKIDKKFVNLDMGVQFVCYVCYTHEICMILD